MVVVNVCVHIVRMTLHTLYTCPCTHTTHARAHIIRMSVCTHRTYAHSRIVRSNARIHANMHVVIACFSFCGGKFMLCCEGSLWCCVCVHIIHIPSHTSYACPCTHPTHARAHIIYVCTCARIVCTYACPLTHRTLQRTHKRKHTCRDTFLSAYLHPHACPCRIQVHIYSIKIKFMYCN